MALRVGIIPNVPVLDGAEMFRLYSSFGLPLDIMREVARERGFALDEAGFNAAITQERERSRARNAAKFKRKQE